MGSSEATNPIIRTRIGNLMFNIHLDASFLSTVTPVRMNRHNHAMTELHFVVSGSGRLVINDGEVPLVPHRAYLIPPGSYHAILSDKNRPLRKYTFRFDIEELQEGPGYQHREIEALKAIFPPISYQDIPYGEGYLTSLTLIAKELKECQLGYYTKLQAYFSEILIDVMRVLTTQVTPADPTPNRINDDIRCHLIDEYFDHYSSHLTLKRLAGLLHLSTRQTNRILQQMYNKTFSEKLADIRIEAAKDLLVTTDLPVLLIAEKQGFASPAFFSKTFKKITGKTPQAYRKSKRGTTNGNF